MENKLIRAIQNSNSTSIKKLSSASASSDLLLKIVASAATTDQEDQELSLDIIKLLITNSPTDNTPPRDTELNTVIHLAAADGLDHIISLYLEQYPFVLDWANSEGLTPLHIASQKGNQSTVQLLLDSHADLELTDNEGNTCLHYAAAWGHLKIVLLLIDRGTPFWAKNNATFTASDYAYSFSIQSALQESARAHFESKKQQRHRDRDKIVTTRQQQNTRLNNNSSSKSSSTSTSTPSITSATMIPKISTSPTTTMNTSTPISSTINLPSSTTSTPINISSPSLMISKSPTNSIVTARTVSYLISKDLEAIQDFRTRSTSLATTTTTPESHNTSRLLPLQLVSAGAGGPSSSSSASASSSSTSSSFTLRPRSSTGNLLSHDLGVRHRADSTDSENGVLVGGGGHGGSTIREGLSRLRYLKSGAGSVTTNTTAHVSAGLVSPLVETSLPSTNTHSNTVASDLSIDNNTPT
ncbi:hypothetical protein Pst134EA_032049 [Puccinia striiformis f. sp. tritici]|uniref:uncharacterized protein n=1 Tax=Puccinia striiformis f. sp. tritici TaxID=168172 RepID=UPI002007EAE9|nr:uncharacterized protein Pst134EA_032049 [Puccinia striiformis f. sp. tritici]KAH9440689.1 hypothetical protein Pst134EA_032049 [Puccinia striiformis f. sp. tritici]KAH9445408.1 hypothetical protein Pst134EB_023249 [Puccinia striiformis f. sp. tritici]